MSRAKELLQSPRFFGVLAFALVLSVQLPFANDDFDIGFESMIGGRFQGPIQRAWISGGFFDMAGRPMLSPLPTIPPSGRTYASHPPLAHWLFHVPVALMGLSEFSLRLVPILCSALAAFILTLFLTSRLGRVAGVASAALWVSTPMVFFYGRMANYESIVFMLAVAACLLVRGDTRRYTALAGVALGLATFTDWAAGFFLPGIALTCWNSKLGWRPVFITSGAVGIAVLAYLGVLVGWEGGIGEAWAALTDAKGLAQNTSEFGFTDFLAAQKNHIVSNFGIGGTLLTVLAVLISLVRVPAGKGDALDELVLTSFIVSIINVGLFPARAYNHDFWWYYLLLASMIATTRCVAAFFRMNPVVGFILLAAFVGEGADRIQTRWHDENPGESRILAAQVDARFDANDLVLMEKNPGSWQFLCGAWIYDSMENVDLAAELVQKLKAGELSVDTVGFWYDAKYDRENPGMLQKWKALGATHEQVGASAILKFTRD